MSELVGSEVKLPELFSTLVAEKLSAKGRPGLVKQLGSMEKVLELCADAWINNCTSKELAKKYKTSYYPIYRFLDEALPCKCSVVEFIKATNSIRPKDFHSYPSIANWEANIRRSGHMGQLGLVPVVEWILTAGKAQRRSQHKRGATWIVESYSCNPEKFDLTEAQKFIDAYILKYQKTEAPKQAIMAIRNFLASKGHPIPRGFGAQYGLSGEKVNYGKHKFVRMEEDQIEAARAYLKDDFEALTFLDWGIECLSRMETLTRSQMDFREKNGKVSTQHFESKTDTTFPKYLLLNIPHCRETWIEIQTLGKGRKYLFFDQEPKDTHIQGFVNAMSPRLKAAYKAAGVTDEYAYKKPFHFLRHTGAHLWLNRTGYDYGLVAEMGWEDLNTLRQCYGGLPPEILSQKIEKLAEANA